MEKSTKKLTIIYLAAGLSSRFGENKLLAKLGNNVRFSDGKPLFLILLEKLCQLCDGGSFSTAGYSDNWQMADGGSANLECGVGQVGEFSGFKADQNTNSSQYGICKKSESVNKKFIDEKLRAAANMTSDLSSQSKVNLMSYSSPDSGIKLKTIESYIGSYPKSTGCGDSEKEYIPQGTGCNGCNSESELNFELKSETEYNSELGLSSNSNSNLKLRSKPDAQLNSKLEYTEDKSEDKSELESEAKLHCESKPGLEVETEIIVVARSSEIIDKCRELPVKVVYSPDSIKGISYSIKAGINAASESELDIKSKLDLSYSLDSELDESDESYKTGLRLDESSANSKTAFGSEIGAKSIPELNDNLNSECVLDSKFKDNSTPDQESSYDSESRLVSEPDYYAFFVADQPFLELRTVRGFLCAALNSGKSMACVCSGGRTGNPALFSAKMTNQLLSLEGDKGGKSIINKNPADTFYYEVPAEELYDIDTKEDTKVW